MDSMSAFAEATEQARMLSDGEVKSSDLVELYLERIMRFDGRLNAFRTVRDEAALAEAAGAQRRLDAGERLSLSVCRSL